MVGDVAGVEELMDNVPVPSRDGRGEDRAAYSARLAPATSLVSTLQIPHVADSE